MEDKSKRGRCRVPFSTSSLLLLSEFQGAPRLGPLDSLALYSTSFQTVEKKEPPSPPHLPPDASPTCAFLGSEPRRKSKSALNAPTEQPL
ncbi:hypothetical protein Q5P01_002282 [Channa striata]|uniref:Uncharacterized protein n=1 Tax=Channa striata TaxID=64152 RepID=A0AA88NU19_CHASR|nr:hypothetical protein Q5P01_002282 [Channa striata]